MRLMLAAALVALFASSAARAQSAGATTVPPSTPTLPTPGAAAGFKTPAPPSSITRAPLGVPPTPAPASPGLPAPPASQPGPGFGPSLGTGNEAAAQLRPSAQPSTAEVAAAQSLLAADGFFHGIVDGNLSGTTRASIRAFQEAARLPATGDLDAATAALLGVPTATAIPSTPSTPGTAAGSAPAPFTTQARSTTPAPFPLSGAVPMSPANQQPPIFIQP